jgi:N-acetylneuraminate synthase
MDQEISKCLIIGEVAQTHDGSLGMAHAFIDAIADAGADGIKFQTHIAVAETTSREPWRVKFSQQDTTRYDYWKRMEFSEKQWHGLKQHSSDRGLLFLSSPFSIEAVELLERVGVYAWKVASGEVSNQPLLERMVLSGIRVWLSSGMSSLAELDAAAMLVKESGCPLTVFQCTSMYPTPPEKIGLNLLPILRQRYHCDIGLSDHSGTIYSGLAAVTIGIEALEVHVTLSREMFGPDVPASITTSELRQLVMGVRFIERMKAQPVDKDALSREMDPLRGIFNKSIVAQRQLPAGTILVRDMLALKKPGMGLPPGRLPFVIGKQLNRNIEQDEEIKEEDLEQT